MLLLIGLGNPGLRYQHNRHNIGFMVADAIVRHRGFSNWRQRFQAEISEGLLGGEKTFVLKPGTMMNLSGRSVGEAVSYLKVPTENVFVFHDELDLAPGKVRVKFDGGHAGHNGLRSIIGAIGADFVRVRLGIGHPGHKELVHSYVLGNFLSQDAAWLDPLCAQIARTVDLLVAPNEADRNAFVSKVNQATFSALKEQQ